MSVGNDNLLNGALAIAIAVVGLATTAVIFSKNAQTGTVVTSAGNAFASIIKAAVGPVS